MSYISNDQVKVFPFGSPRNSDPYARVLNEQNITRLIKSVVDVDRYVVSYDYPIIKFVLAGYYFEANLSSLLFDNTFRDQPVYANIKIKTVLDDTSASTYECLEGGDNTNEFTGVEFTTSNTLSGYQSLKLLTAYHTVPPESLLKFNKESVESPVFDVVYCGTATELID